MTATSEHFTSLSGCVEESRVELASGVVVVSEGELVAGSMVAGESYAGLGEQQAELLAGMNAGEVDAEDQAFIAMEAVNSAETEASELVVGREKILYRPGPEQAPLKW